MSDSEKPQIKIPLTKVDKLFEVIGLMVLVGFWFFTLYYFKALPETIATHFGGNGEPDGYGNKWMILTLPGVGTLLYVMLTYISMFPEKLNYSVELTEANRVKQYTILTRFLRVLKTFILIVFFIGDYKTVQLAVGLPDLFGKWFLLLVFSLIFAPIFYFLIQSSKNA